MKDWIATIVRFHPTASLRMLEEAISSVSIQTHKKIQIIILIQNGSDELTQKVVSLLAKQPQLEPNQEFPTPNNIELNAGFTHKAWSVSQHRVYTLQFNDGGDRRATLLNVGVQIASTKYIAFLDYDDILYPEAYSTLINSISKTQSVVAVGGCLKVITKETQNSDGTKTQKAIEKTPFQNYSILNSKIDLAINNFVAIHSYVVDRTKVNPFDIKITRCTSGRLEDYELLLRLLPLGAFDFSQLHNPLCEYRIREDGSNTIDMFNARSANNELWYEARLQIQNLKLELSMTVGIGELSKKWESLQAANGIVQSRSFKVFLKIHGAVTHFNFIKKILKWFLNS